MSPPPVEQADSSRVECKDSGAPVQRVSLRIGSRTYRDFVSLDAALSHPLGKVAADAELVSGEAVRARLIRRGGVDQWLMVLTREESGR